MIVDGKPNYQIFAERKIINDSERYSLIKILERPFRDKQITTGRCFMPHHTIFIFKTGRISYIEICFHCIGFRTSKDLDMLYAFDERKWTDLWDYFKKPGFKYELTSDEN